jgi:hypothetical protein
MKDRMRQRKRKQVGREEKKKNERKMANKTAFRKDDCHPRIPGRPHHMAMTQPHKAVWPPLSQGS